MEKKNLIFGIRNEAFYAYLILDFKKSSTSLDTFEEKNVLMYKLFQAAQWVLIMYKLFQASQSVLIALFNLNPAEFSVLLSELPKTFQDGATKILHSHIRSASESHSSMSSTPADVLSPRNVASPQGQNRSRPSSR